MGGSIFGKIFRISSFGESHGKALGVVVDGCPAGLSLSEADIQPYLERRRPGKNLKMTQRKEGDQVEILSGVFQGLTTGTPIALMVRNEDQRSKDYGDIAESFRPGHADYGFFSKYGFRDYRGGGRSSGRETLARVAAGAIAKKVLQELQVEVDAKVMELAGISLSTSEGRAEADARILKLREEGDSAGGVVECRVNGLFPGVGEPVFDKLDARIAEGIMSIGAVKAVEIGDGVAASKVLGSENNDSFFTVEAFPESRRGYISTEEAGESDESDDSERGGTEEDYFLENNLIRLKKKSNHSGGILGGMSDGSEILIRASFKPTPSISKVQNTVKESGEPISIKIKGRHDPTVVERATVVVEAMTAIVVLDCLLENMSARLENVKKIYRKE
ncbi:chorismate synthase [Oribacterium parvum ACB1]|uniref:Chorismate synthase n=1 Tax=Oribacterium parvum ACB1 TaxID=796943 RepID=G9WP52_9FIRM|nr:chorismate synthase [Oribacterium parvum]EHL10135.1 chorismate synthase [Oribacterium parvum ACB1]EJF14096.1 putative chorismate synthase [Oribacterium parvum ACB8]